MTHIHIGVPTLDHVPADSMLSYMAMCLSAVHDKKMRRDVTVSLSHVASSNYVDARCIIVRNAQSANASHVLFLDSDMIVPHDVISRLVTHHVPIVGANYVKRRTEPALLLGAPLPQSNLRGTLQPMFHLPLGVMLVSMKVFEALEEPYFSYAQSGAVSEDTAFCARLREHGFTIFCDTSLHIGHVGVKVYAK